MENKIEIVEDVILIQKLKLNILMNKIKDIL